VDKIGKFHVLETLGAGAHSSILRIRRVVDGREYALKLVPIDEPEDKKFLEQAKHEFDIGQRLHHENVLKVFAFETESDWLETVEQYVRQHIADTTLTIPGLAYELAMSESTLLRQLKRLTGLSPIQYVQAVRLEEARHLLESRTVKSVTEVAAKVGYPDARSFGRSFRTRFGKLPSEVLEG